MCLALSQFLPLFVCEAGGVIIPLRRLGPHLGGSKRSTCLLFFPGPIRAPRFASSIRFPLQFYPLRSVLAPGPHWLLLNKRECRNLSGIFPPAFCSSKARSFFSDLSFFVSRNNAPAPFFLNSCFASFIFFSSSTGLSHVDCAGIRKLECGCEQGSWSSRWVHQKKT